jgi:shikimate kinase
MNAQIAEAAPLTSEAPAVTLPSSLRRLILTGFMGAGKTTVGRRLADRLGWEFLDLDALIEQRAGLSVPAIFATHGEEHFRRLESTALVSALGRRNLVLALGGGTPEMLTNRLLLEQTPGTVSIFLDAPFSALFDRCMLQALSVSPAAGTADPIRPLLSDPTAAESRFITRQPIYRRLARLTIPTAELTPEQTITLLLNRLSSL